MDRAAKQHHLTWQKTKNVGLLTAGDCGTDPSTAADCCSILSDHLGKGGPCPHVPSAGWQESMHLPTQRIYVSRANMTLNIINWCCYIGHSVHCKVGI